MGGHPFLESRTKVFWGRKCCYPASSPLPGHNRFRVVLSWLLLLQQSPSHTATQAQRSWEYLSWGVKNLCICQVTQLWGEAKMCRGPEKAFVDEGKWAELWRMDAIWTKEGKTHLVFVCDWKVCWDRAEGMRCGLFTQKEVQTLKAWPCGFEATLCMEEGKEIYFYLIK